MFDTPHVKNYRAEAFDFEAYPVCKPTVLQALVIPSTPLRRASPEFRLVKRRWDNFRKWASASGIQSSWRNQNAVVILGMARHSVTPGPTLRAFLDDPPQQEEFRGFTSPPPPGLHLLCFGDVGQCPIHLVWSPPDVEPTSHTHPSPPRSSPDPEGYKGDPSEVASLSCTSFARKRPSSASRPSPKRLLT